MAIATRVSLWSHDRHDNFKRAGETRKQARIRALNTGGDDGGRGRGEVALGPPLCPCVGQPDRYGGVVPGPTGRAAGASTTAVGGQASYLYLQGGEIGYGLLPSRVEVIGHRWRSCDRKRSAE
jgi:hypothetical protein